MDAPAGTPHYVLSIDTLPGGMFGGSMELVDESGRSSQVFEYMAEGQAPGRFTMTTSAGQADTGTYGSKTLTLGHCGAYLTGLPDPSCTFTYRAPSRSTP